MKIIHFRVVTVYMSSESTAASLGEVYRMTY
ncbi:hypothetical protein CLHUN_38970 [Ruminiclostridium hungatei]|uniref:Uncharacterized protein n=1 Tax=Ruminiclostridium hungatei TaxID=48256 RepID=A0A1V4SG51_RUMHU|nr:hypothetical protein CLHUN_38970 [Ruminiclostridium hungatei]